jgi:hypothetical protein
MPDQNAIVAYAIYPGIGVARVGNSPDEYFIGPEVPGVMPQPEGGYKDSAGRIKRQAARFRIYGLNEDGVAVKKSFAITAALRNKTVTGADRQN